MGEIADDMINGFMCSNCGTCFEKEHGYPVLCGGCWGTAVKEKRVKKVDGAFGDKVEMADGSIQKHIYDEL